MSSNLLSNINVKGLADTTRHILHRYAVPVAGQVAMLTMVSVAVHYVIKGIDKGLSKVFGD